MCFGVFSYLPLLTERYTLFTEGYTHLAPPEQRLEQLNMTFLVKAT